VHRDSRDRSIDCIMTSFFFISLEEKDKEGKGYIIISTWWFFYHFYNWEKSDFYIEPWFYCWFVCVILLEEGGNMKGLTHLPLLFLRNLCTSTKLSPTTLLFSLNLSAFFIHYVVMVKNREREGEETRENERETSHKRTVQHIIFSYWLIEREN